MGLQYPTQGHTDRDYTCSGDLGAVTGSPATWGGRDPICPHWSGYESAGRALFPWTMLGLVLHENQQVKAQRSSYRLPRCRDWICSCLIRVKGNLLTHAWSRWQRHGEGSEISFAIQLSVLFTLSGSLGLMIPCFDMKTNSMQKCLASINMLVYLTTKLF